MDLDLYLRSYEHVIGYQEHEYEDHFKLVVPIEDALTADKVLKLIDVSVRYARERKKNQFTLIICVTKVLGVRMHNEESPLRDVYKDARFFYASHDNSLFQGVEVDYDDVKRAARKEKVEITDLIEAYKYRSGEPRYASSNWTFIKYLSLESFIYFWK